MITIFGLLMSVILSDLFPFFPFSLFPFLGLDFLKCAPILRIVAVHKNCFLLCTALNFLLSPCFYPLTDLLNITFFWRTL